MAFNRLRPGPVWYSSAIAFAVKAGVFDDGFGLFLVRFKFAKHIAEFAFGLQCDVATVVTPHQAGMSTGLNFVHVARSGFNQLGKQFTVGALDISFGPIGALAGVADTNGCRHTGPQFCSRAFQTDFLLWRNGKGDQLCGLLPNYCSSGRVREVRHSQ